MWDQRFDTEEYIYGTEPNDFLREACHHIPAGGKVLCIADGEGRNSVFLAGQGYEVTAVDQSTVGLKKAGALAETNGVSITYQQADLADYDLGDNQWDGIVSIFAHVPPALRKSVHRAVISALKPEGVFLLEAYTPRQLEMDSRGGPPASMKETFMTIHDLRGELDGLDFVIGHEVDRDLNEGSKHLGESAVVQVLARKG